MTSLEEKIIRRGERQGSFGELPGHSYRNSPPHGLGGLWGHVEGTGWSISCLHGAGTQKVACAYGRVRATVPGSVWQGGRAAPSSDPRHCFQGALRCAERLWCKQTAWIWSSSAAAQAGFVTVKISPSCPPGQCGMRANGEITRSGLLLLFCDRSTEQTGSACNLGATLSK